ncbi:efflux RND transporter periplasmic adaptor subunit [Lysobacter auxotrophicus]|uniref:Efflux RND transporter periplasmic adaptor subunit n=1 Tax=Lysobacter auxotrophicus TaxID=2992573 RepID=A0ABM8DHG4_9GAMM|nr:efflux RND transporter periplasmic adaptor subunit [Lysobacter auxotrophicus]BDU18019.1 efflux RND transporter periplasmic adaptor subunit [Lysobacter auxotrophicus]
MRSSSAAAFRLWAWTLVAASTLVLSACGRDDAVEEAPRPVLVIHPTASDHTASAFAGDVRAREESPLSFRVGGKLVQRNVDVGDHVRAGQVLATLDPGDLQAQARAAQAQLAAAEAELGRARADQARFAKLAGEQLVSRSTLDAQNAAATAAQGQVNAARADVEVARNQAAYSQLRATRDGVIAARQAEAGQVVAAGQSVFTLAADGVREVAFAVPETMAGKVKAGQAVQVEAWSRPGQRWNGRIREISPAADPASRTFAARVTVDAPAGAIDLGQSARVYLPTQTSEGLSVPIAALQRENGKASVFVVDTKTSTVKLRPVQIGAFGEDRVPVQGGVQADDWVVAAGGHLLRDGQKVQPVDRDNRPVVTPTATSAR